MRAALVLFALAALARAQDEIYETTWIVGEDGELMGWPDPEAGVDLGKGDLKPFRVFTADPRSCIDSLCAWSWALLLVPGPTDLASLCDPERHLRKTNQNVFDEWLLMSLDLNALARYRTDPKKRRVFLDTLLGWRLLGERRLKEGAPMLESIAAAEILDPITRYAAADIAAELEGRKPTMPDLPALKAVPADADVLVVVDQRRIPRWRGFWRVHNTWAVRDVRRTMARIGAALTPTDTCFAQWILDRECEVLYELARRFGNARVHRTVVALRVPEGRVLAFRMEAEGLFEFDRFAAGCADAGAKVQPREDSTRVELQGATVLMTPDHLTVSCGEWKPDEDPATLGLSGDDAIWIHVRKVPFGLPVKGVETLTLRASFEGGVTVRCRATFKDAEAAKAAAAEIESWKGVNLAPAGIFATPFRDIDRTRIERVRAFLESLKVSVDGTTLTAECTAKGETPESLLEGVVDLEAVYTPFGND